MSPEPAWRLAGGWCRLPKLEKEGNVFLGATTRALGDMQDPEIFSRTLKKAGLDPRSWAGGDQVHGARIRRLRRPTAPRRVPAADGFSTDAPGVALWVRTADCVAAFVLDPEKRAAALVHAGWRGTEKRILEKAIRRMGDWYGSRPSDLRVTLGPHIRDCCYEVGPEVAARFRDVPGAAKPSKRKGAHLLSLARCLRRQAVQAGVRPGRFIDSPHCTGHDRRFYSFRREKTEKRLAAVMVLL